MTEIEAMPGYRKDNPIDLSNYRKLIGYYGFDAEVACCVRRESGTLCREGHRHGFVAELTDDSITIIGNNCAANRFAADSAISKDRRILENRKLQVRRFGRLVELLDTRGATESALSRVMEELRPLRQALDELHTALGGNVVCRLSDMARRSRPVITVTAITVRRYLDERGEPQTERRSVEQRIGVVAGVDLFHGDPIRAISENVHRLTAGFKEAATVVVSKKKTGSLTIDRLVALLGDSDRPARDLAQLRSTHAAFLGNDCRVLCYVTGERVDRYRLAQIALRQQALPDAREKAKALIAELDRGYKKAFGADDLRF
ncbi:hypothetical protein [Luteibacter sp. ME-Dv--P-043b]|uniref:hypothetical protein n=1 Tax=Luteibacter sp. ME-Dv--P-043b TaxID=3040291 RepID=UPI002552C634|nr:hypothetical protein [Luteibacter sp. ME-Dv--P-043b]